MQTTVSFAVSCVGISHIHQQFIHCLGVVIHACQVQRCVTHHIAYIDLHTTTSNHGFYFLPLRKWPGHNSGSFFKASVIGENLEFP